MTFEAPDFRGLVVAVAGDVICDRYLFCEPKSLSREAPVMVLRHVGERVRAGGAGNVARNLTALGAKTSLFGVVGKDAPGREVRHELEQELVGVEGLSPVNGWTTPLKTRVVAAEPRRNPQQVLRIDTEAIAPASAEARHDVQARLRAALGEVDALVLSDYSYGFVDRELGRLAREFVASGHVVVLDPRDALEGFEGLTALTPNVMELAHFAGVPHERLAKSAELESAARSVLERCRARWMLVTRGNHGMALFGEGIPHGGWAIEASGTGNVTDVTGAGDTAAAVFALALARGIEAPDAMVLANAASGVVVMESGASVCSPEALRTALSGAPDLRPLAGSARP
ncbi:MAG TPA: PfkB family carbohydrate kinase [Planctomycetota bacterium]|nr:PfkB family carbohydrate kinase [Planctomycetota bacterium]